MLAPGAKLTALVSQDLGVQVIAVSLHAPAVHTEESHVCPGFVKLQNPPLGTVSGGRFTIGGVYHAHAGGGGGGPR